MKKRRFVIGMILPLLIFSSCGFLPGKDSADSYSSRQQQEGQTEKSSVEDVFSSAAQGQSQPGEKTKAEELLENMSIEEKIGQLFIIRPDALDLDLLPEEINDSTKSGVTQLDSQMAQTLAQYSVGGIALFGKNIASPDQLTKLIQTMQQKSEIPLFVGVDEEGGSVARFANSSQFKVVRFENMQAIGRTGNEENARNVGVTIGTYLKKYGFNLDFAPVSDVNTNPENIVIGNRSFGNDPDLVANMVAAEISGFREAEIMSCVKHFPGHGDTKGDTHTGFVSIEKSWEELKKCELIPFMRAMENKVDMVMVSHITTPNVTQDGLPSSLSYEMIEEKLRGELGYGGVVITDSMAMGAITQNYSSAQSAVKAIQAGVDIILMPEDFVKAYNGIYQAVQNKTISEARIDESVLRILQLKEQYGLLH